LALKIQDKNMKKRTLRRISDALEALGDEYWESANLEDMRLEILKNPKIKENKLLQYFKFADHIARSLGLREKNKKERT
jgi:hypothetical protein